MERTKRRTLADLKDIQQSEIRRIQIITIILILYAVPSIIIFFFISPLEGIWGEVIVIVLAIGAIFAPIILGLLLISGVIKDVFFHGYHLPPGFSQSETIRIGLPDLLEKITEYSKRSEIENRKKIGREIKEICNTVRGMLENPLKGSFNYSKYMDVFTNDLWEFTDKFPRLLNEIRDKVKKQEDIPNKTSTLQHLITISNFFESEGEIQYKPIEYSVKIILKALGLPENENETKEDKPKLGRRIIGYPFVKTFLAGTLLLLVYDLLLIIFKPDMTTGETLTIGALLLATVVGPCLSYELITLKK